MMLLLGIAAAIAAAVALIFLLVDRNRRQRLAQGAALVSRLETLQQLSDLTTVQQYHQAAAGARAISMNRSWEPLVSDGLARELAGTYGLGHAAVFWEAFCSQDGTGKHMYAVARTRILDDLLRKEIGAMVKKEGADIQVVAVGCGMDTRPWRLRGNGFNITWFDVDEACSMELKAKGLQRGGAEQSRAKDGKQKRLEAANALVVDGYHAVSCNVVAGGDLKSSLIKSGFSTKTPTIWLFEELLGWMQPQAACQLLSECSALSTLGSRLLAALPSRPCLDVVHKMRESHTSGPRPPHTLSAVLLRSCLADFGPGSVGHSGWSAFKDETGEMSDYLRSTYRAESFPAYHWTVNSDLGRLKDVEHIVTSSKK